MAAAYSAGGDLDRWPALFLDVPWHKRRRSCSRSPPTRRHTIAAARSWGRTWRRAREPLPAELGRAERLRPGPRRLPPRTQATTRPARSGLSPTGRRRRSGSGISGHRARWCRNAASVPLDPEPRGRPRPSDPPCLRQTKDEPARFLSKPRRPRRLPDLRPARGITTVLRDQPCSRSVDGKGTTVMTSASPEGHCQVV
jgi:hypothetical protein